MAKKMYYNEDEARQTLGVDDQRLEQLISEGRLHAYQDGQKRMFRTQDVDQLAETLASEQTGQDEDMEEIELSPADSAGGIDLSGDTSAGEGGKEDTVITSEGVSVFDEEDLDVDSADPMAKTQIAPSLEDQQNLENVGTGSGLLDLTRESDDTSLGSEVLGQIDMEDTSASQVVGSSISEAVSEPQQAAEPTQQAYPQAQPAAMAAPPDSSAGLFAGFLAGCAILAVVLTSVVMAGMIRVLPGYVEYMKNNMMIVMGGAAGLLLVTAVIGYFVRKPSATGQQG
ncbi:MAG: hypothetical protein ACP5HU_00470 [Phycisphaerae bacterium]